MWSWRRATSRSPLSILSDLWFSSILFCSCQNSACSLEKGKRDQMQLRSSRHREEPSDVQAEQKAFDQSISSTTSGSPCSKPQREGDMALIPLVEKRNDFLLPCSDPARRYNLRSRTREIPSVKSSGSHGSLSKQPKVIATKRAKCHRSIVSASQTQGPRTCPICVERKVRFVVKILYSPHSLIFLIEVVNFSSQSAYQLVRM